MSVEDVLIMIIVAAVPVCFLGGIIAAFMYVWRAIEKAQCSHRLKGKVENAVVSFGSAGWSDCQKRLCYTYKDIKYKVIIKKAPRPLNIGDEVDVFINPDYPNNYWIPSDKELAELDK